MKIKQITENTTSGAVATVNSPLGGTQRRGNPSIYGGKKVGSLFKGKKTKAPYANSVNESAELSETQLEEDDVIVVPGQGRSRKNGFVPHGKSRIDHEVQMARSDLFSAAKNAQQVYSMIKDVGEDEGLDGWVQEKIIKANDYLNTVREYLEGKQVQGVSEGVADMHSNELLNTVRGAIRKAIKETGDQSLSKIFVCLRNARPASEALKNITSPNSLAEVDNALQEVGIDLDDLLNFINKQAEKYGKQGVAEGMFTKAPAIDPTIGKQINDIINRLHNHAKRTKDEYLKEAVSELYIILRNTGGTYSPPGHPGVRDVAEGWQEDSQELEDWSKEVNKRLYRAHESQRPALARQLSKLEQKNFGSNLNQGSLTELVHSALKAIQKGQMVHYDPQSVGQMPFGSIVGDEARMIAASGMKKYDIDGYRGLQRAGIVDNFQQFLHLRDLADNQGQAILKYTNMPPVAAWMQFIKDIGWSKDDMNEEVQAKTNDKLLAYYAQRKAEKQKQQQGMAEGKRNLKCVCKTHGQDQCPVHAPIDEGSKSANKNKKA